MSRHQYHQRDNEDTQVIRKLRNVVELAHRKHLLVTALKGISMYAHWARQFTFTDREIDLFTLDTLEAAVSDKPMGLDQLQRLLDRADEMRKRAKKLYLWACELFSRVPETLSGASDERVCITSKCLPSHAAGKTYSDDDESAAVRRERLYWEGVCAQNLNHLAKMALAQPEAGTASSDAAGLVHEALSLLSLKRQTFEIIDLAVFLDEDPTDLLYERRPQEALVEFKIRHRPVASDEMMTAQNY
jgi:hypothetical protein